MIKVIKSQFIESGIVGDFEFMIKQPEYCQTLFVFNDNEEQFLSHLLANDNPYGAVQLKLSPMPQNPGGNPCSEGGGNAAIRPYQCAPHRRAVGIPTGNYQPKSPHHMGYSSLDGHVRQMVSYSMLQIEAMLASGRFTALAFSYSPETKLGGRIFKTAQTVRDFIVEELLRVAGNY